MKLFITVLGIILTNPLYATDKSLLVDPLYHQIKKVEVRELSDLSLEELAAKLREHKDSYMLVESDYLNLSTPIVNLQGEIAPGASGSRVVGQLYNFSRYGKLIYQIIKENAPVRQTEWDALSVLPENVKNWSEMSGWSAPASKVYQVAYVNAYGMEVVTFTYRLSYSYGGSYKGTGSYLGNLQISPVQVRVLWGYKLNAKVMASDIRNVGLEKSPVPGLDMKVHYEISTMIVDEERVDLFYVTGDGTAQRLE